MNFKEGDCFRWYYKDDEEYRKRSPGTAYWCMDNLCFALNRDDCLYLVDTYWQDYDSHFIGQSTHVVDPEKVDLEFVCNLNDIEFIPDYRIQDYDKVYNLSRQKHCYKKYAIDKGVQPSKIAILKKLENQLQRAHEDLRYAQWSIERITKEIEELNK